MIGVQTCPSEENKIVGVEQIHDKSGQPDKCSHATPTMSYFVKELRKTWTIAECQRLRIDSENGEPPEST